MLGLLQQCHNNLKRISPEIAFRVLYLSNSYLSDSILSIFFLFRHNGTYLRPKASFLPQIGKLLIRQIALPLFNNLERYPPDSFGSPIFQYQSKGIQFHFLWNLTL
ncbi:hypothetical protein CEXT_49511 [Caerostris extrusa]|uniref:Uncharacterized protein n=1 Tax=Caerostris extrusa TaxID=172846 RepID=A0AAV4WK54_CAEEX|nr:hypothetical protein CEXT_49511 [Caerostris extrusa]